MWPFRKKNRPSRLEPKKAPSKGLLGLWQRARRSGAAGSVLLAAALYVGVLALVLPPLEDIPYRVGQFVPRDITSRVDFRIENPKRLAAEAERAWQAAPPVFTANRELLDQIDSTLRSLPGQLHAATRPADLGEVLRQRFGLKDPNELARWQALADESGSKRLGGMIDRLGQELLRMPVVRPDDMEILAARIELVARNDRREVPAAERISTANAERIEAALEPRVASTIDAPLRPAVTTYLIQTLSRGRPIYLYDPDLTRQRKDAARQAVYVRKPDSCFDLYGTGDVLVRRSRHLAGGQTEIAPLTAEGRDLLAAEQEAFLDAEIRRSPLIRWGWTVGRAGVLLLVVALLCGYIATYKPRIVRNHWRGVAVAALILLMLLATRLLEAFHANPYGVVLPVLAAAMIMAIAYDRRFALVIGSTLALLVVLQQPAGLDLLIVLGVGVASGVAQMQETRTRGKLIRVSGVAGAAVFLAVWMVALAQRTPWPITLTNATWAATSALLAGFLIQGLLPLIERAFGIATSLTLLDWCDPSKPLLQRLRTEAPGTYNHCLQLGSMCEAAAEAIGANGLLARVGAYYHDIGKINKPDYFVENQSGSASRHEKLSPAMSLLIITGHVKDGLEMAREYGLPRILHEFITTHHGTTLVQYFYKAATERRKADVERAPDEVEFRYPGPKPRSKEAAILMLADAAESSTRAMTEATPGRIENQVHTMVTRRLTDGQLDECDLTLKEVHQIEAALVRSLCAMHHQRLAYPTPKGEAPSAAEIQAEEKLAADAQAKPPNKAETNGAPAAADPQPPAPAATPK